MALTIIIVNYKSTRLVLDCLEHLYRDAIAGTFNVLIVDNASGDDGRQVITSAFPRVTWIPMTYNAGFARANNEGIRRSAAGVSHPSPGDAFLLLNGDTLPHAGAIPPCYARPLTSKHFSPV